MEEWFYPLHATGVIVLVALVVVIMYLPAYLLPPLADKAKFPSQREINALLCGTGLSIAAGIFNYSKSHLLLFLAAALMGMTPSLSAGIAGRRPFVFALVSTFCFSTAVWLAGSKASPDVWQYLVSSYATLLQTLLAYGAMAFVTTSIVPAIWKHHHGRARHAPSLQNTTAGQTARPLTNAPVAVHDASATQTIKIGQRQ